MWRTKLVRAPNPPQGLAMERESEEKITLAVETAKDRQRLLMESQEMERRMMAREEERTLRRDELIRRRREKEPR